MGVRTIAIIIAQSSIPGFRLFILDKSRSITANRARETPTIAVTEIVLVLFRSGRLQLLSVMYLVAINIKNTPNNSYEQNLLRASLIVQVALTHSSRLWLSC